MSENPNRVEIEQQAFASRRSSVFRSVVLGIGFTGIVLGLLPFVLSMSGPLAARCEMLGGLLAIGACSDVYFWLNVKPQISYACSVEPFLAHCVFRLRRIHVTWQRVLYRVNKSAKV